MTDNLDVFVDGSPTGQLTRATDDTITFDYSTDSPDLTPALSVSMPRSLTHHRPEVVMPWLDNLLPDNDDVRTRWARAYGLRRVTAYDLLRHVGADCAGAVQILPTGETPSQSGETIPISQADIAAHIRTLRADTTAWDFARHGGHWSLGGQQGKFTLVRTSEGAWALPTGRAASTHIVKVGVPGVPDADVAEFVTTRAAALLGLPVPEMRYATFGDEVALLATRFDRYDDGQNVRRLHQEDLCQALGLWRTMKYQADGGPSAADIVRMMRQVLDPRDRQRGVDAFVKALVFNWITAGTDAHAKNFALLHLGPRIILAPFYDLISTALLWPARQVHYEGRLAMKFGGEYRLRKVDMGRYEQAGLDLEISPDHLVEVARHYREHLAEVVRQALSELPDAVSAATRSDMLARITDRLSGIRVP